MQVFNRTKNDVEELRNQTLFWDTDISKIDFLKHGKYVIERVLTRGSLDAWFIIKNNYGLEQIKQVALNARWLDEKTLAFCSTYFQIPQEQFKCYIWKQSNLPHLNY